MKGVWELARLHTKESWLCWYPAGKDDCFRSRNEVTVANKWSFFQFGEHALLLELEIFL